MRNKPWRRVRGGYRPYRPPAVRVGPRFAPGSVGQRLGQTASSAYALYQAAKRKYPNEVANIERKIGEGISGATRGLIDKIKSVGSSGQLVPVRLMRGITSASGTGDVTETQFSSTTIGKVSDAVETVLKSAVSLSVKSNCNGKIQCAIGGQAVSSLSSSSPIGGYLAPSRSYYSTCAIMGGLINTGDLNTPVNWGSLYSLYRSNPLSITSSTTYNNVGYFYVDKAVGELTLTNSGTTSAIVDVYEVLSKEDVGVGYSDSGQRNTQLDYVDPYYLWYNGMANYQVGDEISSFYSLSKIVPETIGCQPNASQFFNAYFEICAHHRITMAINAVHVHKSNYDYGQLIPVVRMTRNANLRNITRNLLIVVRGIPGTTGNNNNVDLATSVTWTHNITNFGKVIMPSTKITTEIYSDSIS